MWTGMNDLAVPGFFAWSNEHLVTFTYWAPGTPKNHNSFSEDCVEMLHQVGEGEEIDGTGVPRNGNL